MTKIFLSLILLLTVTSVLALDCQYTVEEKVTVPRFVFKENGTELNYALLTIDDFHRHNIVPMGELIAIHSFRVTNNYNDKINVTVTFNSPGPDSETLLIDAKSFARIKRPDTIPWSIDESSIVLYIHNEGLEAKKEYDSTFVDTCLECPPGSGFICIDDGKPSPSAGKCGSGMITAAGICSPEDGIPGDGLCSKELGENCKNSAKDCPVASNHICNNKGEEVDDCNNPPESIICCPSDIPPFKIIGPSQKCENGNIVDDCRNPPAGMQCCQGVFKKEKETPLDFSCKCDFECKEGVCFEEKCQEIFDPKIRCPSGTNVKEGTSFLCNIYVSNVKSGQDIKVTFTLEAGSGLSFSSTQGCHNVKGSQCIGNYDVADLSNEGINVELNAVAAGDSKVEGTVVFEYQGKKIEKKASPVAINVVEPNDGSVGPGKPGPKIWPEWLLRSIIAIIALIVITFCTEKILSGATNLSKAKMQEISKRIEEIHAKVQRKEREVKHDENLMEQLSEERAAKEEIVALKERKERAIIELKDLRQKEKQEKERLNQDRLLPFVNKQNYKVIINDEGYEQFPRSLKYFGQKGELFHRWHAKKNIYYKNRDKYQLPWNEYEVHHKDGEKRNNDLSNLEILSKEEHKRKHNL